jgi:hypothetical protein
MRCPDPSSCIMHYASAAYRHDHLRTSNLSVKPVLSMLSTCSSFTSLTSLTRAALGPFSSSFTLPPHHQRLRACDGKKHLQCCDRRPVSQRCALNCTIVRVEHPSAQVKLVCALCGPRAEVDALYLPSHLAILFDQSLVGLSPRRMTLNWTCLNMDMNGGCRNGSTGMPMTSVSRPLYLASDSEFWLSSPPSYISSADLYN